MKQKQLARCKAEPDDQHFAVKFDTAKSFFNPTPGQIFIVFSQFFTRLLCTEGKEGYAVSLALRSTDIDNLPMELVTFSYHVYIRCLTTQLPRDV